LEGEEKNIKLALNHKMREYNDMKTVVSANSMSIKATIFSQIRQVAQEQNKKLAPLTDDLVLLESGLDSLSFAILVAHLEDALGMDPFSVSNDVSFPVTLGQFVRYYEDAAK
jgi:hypothetical protein